MPPILNVELAERVVPNPSQISVPPLMVGIAGLGFTVSVPLLIAMPIGVVTEIVPVVPPPTVAVICVAEFTTKLLTAVPPMLTAVAPVRLVPVMTTVLPMQAVAGENVLIIGSAEATVTVKATGTAALTQPVVLLRTVRLKL